MVRGRQSTPVSSALRQSLHRQNSPTEQWSSLNSLPTLLSLSALLSSLQLLLPGSIPALMVTLRPTQFAVVRLPAIVICYVHSEHVTTELFPVVANLQENLFDGAQCGEEVG